MTTALAKELIEKQQFDDALPLVRSLLSDQPQAEAIELAWVLVGALEEARRYQPAIELCDRLLELECPYEVWEIRERLICQMQAEKQAIAALAAQGPVKVFHLAGSIWAFLIPIAVVALGAGAATVWLAVQGHMPGAVLFLLIFAFMALATVVVLLRPYRVEVSDTGLVLISLLRQRVFPWQDSRIRVTTRPVALDFGTKATLTTVHVQGPSGRWEANIDPPVKSDFLLGHLFLAEVEKHCQPDYPTFRDPTPRNTAP